MQDWIHKERRLDKGASQNINKLLDWFASTIEIRKALGVATHYYKSVDSDMRLNDPLKERTNDEPR